MHISCRAFTLHQESTVWMDECVRYRDRDNATLVITRRKIGDADVTNVRNKCRVRMTNRQTISTVPSSAIMVETMIRPRNNEA